jgi:hypothetical protein
VLSSDVINAIYIHGINDHDGRYLNFEFAFWAHAKQDRPTSLDRLAFSPLVGVRCGGVRIRGAVFVVLVGHKVVPFPIKT